ncbi:hypothetical protein MGG_10222 [Pyricularia oryzae 70-15]|uniref:Uncharacterized protein n=1 Tax=Pyricularia oryzae (strain 70-15 / ATCC MYA-4617 / FGSC 8958) TaxID=242507 RepID=A0A151V4U3_PYRO7|nr:uncharacterized protein MGG_10222 [Pyricularia oryzae 70-15]KYQ30586.1 hypothetical protein MGG_10222 [Pyricularia oryzae 70-15]
MAGGFRGAGIIPHNPETVISKLDVKLRTPSPEEPAFPNTDTWVSQTPHNPTEALAKGMEQIAHQNTLLLADVTEWRAWATANRD